MTNKSTKPLKLVEGGYYRTRDGQVFGPMSDTKDGLSCPYDCGLGDWYSWASTGKWMPGDQPYPLDLIERVPAPKAKPAKKPRAKRVPTERSFRDMDGTELCVRLGTSGVIFGRHGGYQKISHKTASALGEYLSALADRSGK